MVNPDSYRDRRRQCSSLPSAAEEKKQTAAMQQFTFSGREIFSSGNNYASCIRISFGKPWNDDTDYGLMMLGKIIKKMI